MTVPIAFLIFVQAFLWSCIYSSNIELLECTPPDYPRYGGYGPRQDYYTPGDMIHYFCDVDTYIGGNYLRICMDSGDWTGLTPVCDPPEVFTTVEQTSTAEPWFTNEAEFASDGSRSTCSSTSPTAAEIGRASWTGTFAGPSHLLRVMLFLPKGDAAYEVLSVKADGSEYSCGRGQHRIERYEWVFHNCLEPNNTGITTVKIKSLTNAPLQLCEVVAHTLTDPTCNDPRLAIENGRMQITRKEATLVCNPRHTKSKESKIKCIRTGVWERKNLYCAEQGWVEAGPEASP